MHLFVSVEFYIVWQVAAHGQCNLTADSASYNSNESPGIVPCRILGIRAGTIRRDPNTLPNTYRKIGWGSAQDHLHGGLPIMPARQKADQSRE